MSLLLLLVRSPSVCQTSNSPNQTSQQQSNEPNNESTMMMDRQRFISNMSQVSQHEQYVMQQQQQYNMNNDDAMSLADKSLRVSVVDQDAVEDDESLETNDADLFVRRETRLIKSLKLVVMAILVAMCIGMGWTTYRLMTNTQDSNFRVSFNHTARRLVEGHYQAVSNQMWAGVSLATTFQVVDLNAKDKTFPNIILPGFDLMTYSHQATANVPSIGYGPILRDRSEVTEFDAFGVLVDSILQDDMSPWYQNRTGVPINNTQPSISGYGPDNAAGVDVSYQPARPAGGNEWQGRSRSDGVFEFEDSDGWPVSVLRGDREGPFNPTFQVTTSRRKTLMLDMFSDSSRAYGLHSMMECRLGTFSPPLDPSFEANLLEDDDILNGPRSMLFMPVFESPLTIMGNGPNSGTEPPRGVISLEVDWSRTLGYRGRSTVPLIVVLSISCGNEGRTEPMHTYKVLGMDVTYLGPQDLHDPVYDEIFDASNWTELSEYRLRETVERLAGSVPEGLTQVSDCIPGDHPPCRVSIKVYPTKEFEALTKDQKPLIYTCSVVASIVLLGCMFLGYSWVVERRQHKVMDRAMQSSEIVDSLFPEVVRDRLFGANSGRRKKRQQLKRRRSILAAANAFTPNPLISPQQQQQHHHHHHHHHNQHQEEFSQNSSIGADDDSVFENLTASAPKGRLSIYLQERNGGDTKESRDAPIAEMFPHTTIIFADIVGFTAWSSQREPAQVFTLLETLYRRFDVVAKRLGVFKVETIGDCYVAVTGLPTPNKDHAVIMARFAYEILQQMSEITKKIEISLGPGTSDLGLRIGLHSGPVTAGVLRGEKSRFQLFGDTMNTASRMESTSEKNSIQVSSATAEFIKQAGKEHWLTEREGPVVAKGKGTMQTYWLKPRRKDSTGPAVIKKPRRDTTSTFSTSPVQIVDTDGPQTAPIVSRSPSPDMMMLMMEEGIIEMDDAVESAPSIAAAEMGKRARLIDWNVEILLRRLSKVVAMREDGCANLIDSTRSLGPWTSVALGQDDDGDGGNNNMMLSSVLDEVSEVIALPKFEPRSVRRRSLRGAPIGPAVKSQLRAYVSMIASCYRDVPFHNFEHASHVAQSADKMMNRILSSATDNTHQDSVTRQSIAEQSELHYSTFGISSDPLTQFAVVFAAVVHDVDHTGVPNVQLVKEGAEVAAKYGNKSVAEQHSVHLALRLLSGPQYTDLQNCICATDDERNRFRQLLVNLVIATDIADKQLHTLRRARWQKAFENPEDNCSVHNSTTGSSLVDEISSHSGSGTSVELSNRKATIVIEHIIQASDVAHTMQHWHVFCKWNERLFLEMYRAYQSGRAESDPLDGWYEGQLAFFDKYIIPLAKKLENCGVFGVSSHECLTFARANRLEWEAKGREVTEDMMERAHLSDIEAAAAAASPTTTSAPFESVAAD